MLIILENAYALLYRTQHPLIITVIMMVNHREILYTLCETFWSQTVKLQTPSRAYHAKYWDSFTQNLIQATIHQKMMKLPLFFFIIFILLHNLVESRIFESETINRSTCTGSLMFRQRNGKLLTISGDMNVTKIYVESVSMQGCGCYHMFSGRYGKVRLIPFQWTSRKA